MNRGSLSALVGRLRRSVRAADAQGLTDADLLQRWLKARDEAAFELLVWRHGRLVLSVCRRLLDTAQDVEDAFQATFLVLVRKAASIARKQAVASWLYTVAYRIASEARQRAGRLPDSSPALDQLPSAERDPAGACELRRVLDEEVNRLPERYRLPFVLCHLEGKTNEEAARELGCPLGTVLSRLSRARDRLRERLARRGVAPAALVAGSLAVGEVVSAELVSSTARAAVALAAAGAAGGAVSVPVAALVEGVLRTMFLAKVKASLAVVLTVAIVGVSGGLGYHAAIAQDEGGGAKTAGAGTAKKADDLPPETRKMLQMVEQLQRELQQSQERTQVLQARLTWAQDQLGMKRTNPPPKDRPKKMMEGDPAYPSARGMPVNPAIDEEKDRIDILRAKVAIKEAELSGAKALLAEATKRQQRVMNLRNSGAVSEEEASAAQMTVGKYSAEVRVKEAELLEASILVRQAERRLKAIAGEVAPGRTLEQRVAELEREVAELRRRMGGTGLRVPTEGAKMPAK